MDTIYISTSGVIIFCNKIIPFVFKYYLPFVVGKTSILRKEEIL